MAITDWLMWIRLAMKIMELLDEFFDDDDKKNVFISRIVTSVKDSGVIDHATG